MALRDLFEKFRSRNENKQNSHVQSQQEKELYGQKTYSIDDFELADMIIANVSKEAEQFENAFSRSNRCKIEITVDQAKQIAREFFKTIGGEFEEKALEILNGTAQNIDLQIEQNEHGKHSSVNAPQKDNTHMTIKLVDFGTIDTLYDLVHEITHTFDTKNYDHTTRKILGETAPHCMERMLDDFLLNMSQEELSNYNIDKEEIKENVLDKQILTIISLKKNAENLQEAKRNPKNTNRVIDSRYMIALIVSSYFADMDNASKLPKLQEFIKQVENDDMTSAFKAMGMEMDRSQTIARKSYIETLKKRMEKLIERKQEHSNGWSKINLKLQNSKQKAFLYERNMPKENKPYPDAPDKIVDLILAEEGSIIAFSEISITPDKIAHLCTQEQMEDLALEERLPMGIRDNQFLATSNDVAILVDDKHRGNKLGEKLLEATLMYLHGIGVETMMAEDVRQQALSFYIRNGGEQIDNPQLPQPQVKFDVEKAVAQIIQKTDQQFEQKRNVEKD